MNETNKNCHHFLAHMDSQFTLSSLIAVTISLLCVSGIFLLPETVSGKNSTPEYLQLFLLLVGMTLAFTANNKRPFFIFVGFVLLLLMLREINFGRTLPCFADPNDPNKFKKWKEIPYGWLAHVFIGIYLGAMVVFFFVRKLYYDAWQLLKSVRIPLWECLIMALAAVCALMTERVFHSDFVEEFFELSFYGALICLVWRFTRGKYRTTDSL